MGRAIGRLNALAVQRLSKQPGLHSDGGGLYLRVTSPTARSWVLRYMLNGKAHEMGLGPYPEVSLADAREKTYAARKLKSQGKDPIAERESLRAAERAKAAHSVSFRQCAEAYIGARKDGWKSPKHAAQWTASLETYVMPVIGDLPVQSVDVGLVSRILEPIWSKKPETASRIRGRIEAILDWARTRGYRQGETPARWKGHLENLFPPRSQVRQVKHHPALPYREMGAFMAALKAEAGMGALALQFTILTAARTGEVIGATWSEINLAERVWTVPADRMKAGREHRVPLSKEAMAILQRLHEVSGGRGFVFPGEKEGKPLSNMAMLKTRARMGRSDVTVHGFRSTFRDYAAERTNFPNEVCEAALAHVVGDKVEAAYRRSDLFEKRRGLMDAWGEFCTRPAEGTSVVALRQHAA
ncbi:MAG: tyrosine-type recombinase/integrase [Alphaproteobacteria bacterium]